MPTNIKRSEIRNVDKEWVQDYSGVQFSRYQVIAYVGNNSESWRMKREDAVRRIRNREEEFFTRHPITDREIPVEIYRDDFLRSERDDKKTDNLDELPECSRNCTLRS